MSNIGIVLSGTAQIENNDIWGNTSILGLVKPGEVFAEAYACVPGEPMMVDVIATEDTEILFVNVPEIFRLASSGKGNYTRLIQNLVKGAAGRKRSRIGF
ncbi:MAG: cyclic nucleotide-binding domain-containing protein [Blautia wexlerae]